MFAAYHEPIQEALQLAARLSETGGINYVRVFVRYLAATQEEKTVEAFAVAVEQQVPQKGQKIMTFAQQLLQEGEIRAKIEMIEKLLQAGISWATIETAIEINPTRFAELKQELARLTVPKGIDPISTQLIHAE